MFLFLILLTLNFIVMDWFYIAGIIVFLFLMILGVGGIAYFVNAYYRDRIISFGSKATLAIALIIGICICIGALVWVSDTIKCWLIIAAALMCVAIPMIVSYVVDRRKNPKKDAGFNFYVHMLFILAVLCFPGGRIGMAAIEQAFEHHVYQHGILKVIDHIKTDVLLQTDYQWVEGSWSEVAIPNGKKNVEWIVLVMTDDTEFPVCRKVENVNYEKLYPQGDTVFIYNGNLYPHQ